MREGIRRDALPSGIFFSKLLVFGDRDKFHVVFTTPNLRIFNRAARYANRAEIDPGPRDSQKRKIGLPICRNIAVFSVFAFFRKKQIAVLWLFRHLRLRSRGNLAAQRNWRQFYTLKTFSVQSVELYANLLQFLNLFQFFAKSLHTVLHFEDVLCWKCRTVFEHFSKTDTFRNEFY